VKYSDDNGYDFTASPNSVMAGAQTVWQAPNNILGVQMQLQIFINQ
jgi:hypothetical protein